MLSCLDVAPFKFFLSAGIGLWLLVAPRYIFWFLVAIYAGTCDLPEMSALVFTVLTEA